MNNNEWTGRLYSDWNRTYAYARAIAAEAIGDPYVYASLFFYLYQSEDLHPYRKLSAWPKYLQLELVADNEISTLDIQAWIRQTKAPVVRLEYTNGTDNCYFENLIETIRNARGVSFCSVSRAESSRIESAPQAAPTPTVLVFTVSRFCYSTQL